MKSYAFWEPQTGSEELRLIAEVLADNYPNEGIVTTRFEDELARLLGCKHVVAVTSGTAAIFLALVGVGVGPGDEVIVPDVTFVATANAVVMAGAKPILVDVDSATLTIDPEAIIHAITPRTKAVVPVHVSGRAADMASIMEIADAHGLAVVEDAAEALTSKLHDKCLGTFGRAGCLSFASNKTITTGQGGAILTDDDTLHVRLRELKDQGRAERGTGGDDMHPRVGYNFKFTNLQAAVGLGQMKYLEARVRRLKEIYHFYLERLSGLSGISLIGFRLNEGESPQWVDAIVEARDELDQYLQANGIFCRRFWFPVHTHAPYRLPNDKFPNSTRLMPHALWLPSSFTFSDEDLDYVCSRIEEFFEKG